MIDYLQRHLPARRTFAFYRALNRIALKGMGFNNWRSMEESGELWVIRHLLPSLIKTENPVLADVGAHRGEYSNELLQVFPRARVHAFEPHPRTFALLEKEARTEVVRHAMALGAQPGIAELYDRANDDGSVHASLSQDAVRTVYQNDIVVHQVQVTTLDEWRTRENIDVIDFLKIDTEGFEMDVLSGAADSLSNGKVGVIQFEFNSLHVGRRQFLEDFIQKLPEHRLYRVLRDGMVALDRLRVVEREIFAYQNIVALPKAIAPAKA